MRSKSQSKWIPRIWLAVNPTDNVRAKALYERLGYVHNGGEPYLDGVYGDYEDWVVDLEKDI
jgi:ribosomal protein S18 acetylase RimI-like enzyme